MTKVCRACQRRRSGCYDHEWDLLWFLGQVLVLWCSPNCSRQSWEGESPPVVHFDCSLTNSKCRNQVGHCVSDQPIDYPDQLFFGLSFGPIDHNRDLLVDALLSDDQPSLPSFLWLLGVAHIPRGAISDTVHTSIGRWLVHRDLLQYVQGPVEWGVPLGPRRRL